LSNIAGSLIQQPTGQGVSGYSKAGIVTILQGQNSVVLAHGLTYTPIAIVGPTSDTGVPFYYTIDGTNLTVYLSAHGLALQNLTFQYILF
jgi:hypothetical protein